MRFVRGVLLVLVAMAALGLAACGDDDNGGGEATREEYEQALTDFGNDFEGAFTQLGNIQSVETPEEAAGLLDEAETLTREAASELEAIEPPADVADPHARLVGALTSLADTFSQAAEAAEAGDTGRLSELTSAPPAAVAELEEAAQEIEDAGYNPTD